MRSLAVIPLVAALAVIAGCTVQEEASPPAPFALTEEAMGRYCGMNVLEHAGPKGQIILTHLPDEPIWFSSVRDTVAFTLLPEEPKNIAAIYVSDMAAAPSWEEPGAMNWIDAKEAYYVVGSSVRGGMGVLEAVPFSTADAAAEFAQKNGGEVVRFAEIPPDYILGTGPAEAAPAADSPDAAASNSDTVH